MNTAKNYLAGVGLVIVLVISFFTFVGAKVIIQGAQQAFYWSPYDYTHTAFNIILSIVFIRWMANKKFVIVDKPKETEQEYDILEDDSDDWSILRKVKESELPNKAEVLRDLDELAKMDKSSAYWKSKAKTAEVKRFASCRTFCLTQKKKAEAREEKKRKESARENSLSPTVEFT